jgi:putative acetyltransferase
MDALTGGAGGWAIAPDSPLAPDVRDLLQVHLQLMHASSPPESVHALPAEALAAPGVHFFTLRAEGRLLAVGALSRVSARHCEIKSMHVRSEARGYGLARHLLNHLLAEARALGYERVSLETGVEAVFAPARSLYLAAGFRECPPFGAYRPDPNSVFFTRPLTGCA